MEPLNDELIDEVLARIEAEPEGWDQADFFGLRRSDDDNICGTTACFAGHALLASGWTMELREGWAGLYPHVRDAEGQSHGNYERKAAELLGFTHNEVNRVFYGAQDVTIDEMRAIIADIRAERAKAASKS